MRFPGLEPALVPYAAAAFSLAHRYHISPRLTSVRRSWSEQTELRQAYEAGISRWPANRPGDSPHQYGVAFDSTVPAHQQEQWNQIRRYYGWHVPANDVIHAEFPNWRAYREHLRLT